MTPLSPQLITDKNQWEKYVSFFAEANFLQSWNWGVFHQQLGKKIIRLALVNEDQVVGLVQGVVESARRGRYLSVAGGPLVRNSQTTSFSPLEGGSVDQILSQRNFVNLSALNQLVEALVAQAKENNCIFIRVRPQVIDSDLVRDTLHQLKAIPSPMHVTADLTLQLDLSKPTDQLLMDMRKNTRYEIKRAEKLGIRTVLAQNPDDIKTMYEYQLVLAKKHSFVPFSYQFWSKQFEAFLTDNQVSLCHAYQGSQLLASAFIIFYNGEAVYHYGTSTPANHKQPGSYACQWAAIQEAKQRGCLRYNFWGIAPQDQPTHRFAGVSLFKRGFGGQEVQYVPAHDIPLGWQYTVTKNFELLRKKWRRL